MTPFHPLGTSWSPPLIVQEREKLLTEITRQNRDEESIESECKLVIKTLFLQTRHTHTNKQPPKDT